MPGKDTLKGTNRLHMPWVLSSEGAKLQMWSVSLLAV